MYAILRGAKGLPVALFEIERETEKRYYGKLVDFLYPDEGFMFLPGHTRTRSNEQFVLKTIVQCVLRTDRGWYENKDRLTSTLATFIRNHATLETRRHEFNWEIRDAQSACLKASKGNVRSILADYV